MEVLSIRLTRETIKALKVKAWEESLREGERVTPSSLIRRAIEHNILGPGAEGGERPNPDAH